MLWITLLHFVLRSGVVREPLFADDGVPVVAGDVVELDAVIVDSVQDAQAGLATLTVVRLGAPISKKFRK